MRAGRRGDPARAAVRAGDGRPGAAARVHERREPAARARDGAAARDGRARGARREPRPARPADGHRGPAALRPRRPRRLRRRPMGRARLHLAARSRRRSAAATSTRRSISSVFLFSLGAAIVTGVVIGLWPAWRASRADARAALHDGGKATRTASIASACAACSSSARSPARSRCSSSPGLFVRTLTSAQRHRSRLRRRAAHHGAARSETDRLRRRPDQRVLQGAAAPRRAPGRTSRRWPSRSRRR